MYNNGYFSTNSTAIQPGTLIGLLIESVLDGLFFAAAAPGVSSPWVYTAPSLGTKQSGATFVVQGDHNNGSMEMTIPRQLDALINMGIVFILLAVVYDSTTNTNVGLTYNVSGKNVKNDAIADANFGPDHKLASASADVSGPLAAAGVNHANAQGVVLPPDNMAAYIQFAQYAIVKKVSVQLNASSIAEMTGEELLILHDVYGCGIHGLDVLGNGYFNSNDYSVRAAQSAVPSVHIISLSLWWSGAMRINQHLGGGQEFKNAFLPSSVAYSPLTVHVEFNTPQSVGGKTTTSAAATGTAAHGTFETDTSNLNPKFVFDAYFMTSAEKEIVQQTSNTTAYRKTNKGTFSGSLAKGTQNLNFNFVGADIIAWASKINEGALGKLGQAGQNDAERKYLKQITYSLNHNKMPPVDHTTTKWAFINGATHMPRLGALYFSAAPGSDLQAVMYNTPIATIPYSRAENTSMEFELSDDIASDAASYQVNVLTNVYSALARSNGTMSVLYS